MKKQSKQHDELESTAAREKRLGITAKTRRAAKKYAKRLSDMYWFISPKDAEMQFLAGAAWERRRRAKDGY